MKKKQKSFAGRLTSRLLIWVIIVTLGLSFVILRSEKHATTLFYSEIFHNKMLITNEYVRRVISDVYVAVTNNIYFIEHNLDDPDCHKKTMERIVKSSTRVRSCGISFIEDYYYPQKEHRFCPFAWRNSADPDVIYSQDMGDADLDYLTADWFLDVVKSDSAQWSEPFYDGYDEKTTLSAYEVPIHDQEGRVVAVLGADISLDWLTNKLNEADTTINKSVMMMTNIFEMKSNSFIINHDGSYITNPDGKRIMKDKFFTHLKTADGNDAEELISRMKNGVASEDRGQEKFLVDGEECYLFYNPVKYTQWVLVTVVPCRAVDILSQLNAAVLLFIFLLAMLLIIIVGYYYIRNGIYPLKQLTKVAGDIAKGKFDTTMPEMKHNDEISQLRDAIEEMQYRISNHADNGRKL
jgi:HAMP domain-containing protein